MSSLALDSEILSGVLEGRRASRDGMLEVASVSLDDPQGLLETASILRGRACGRTVTFSKKAFFNIINLCQDTCTYCTYKSEPGSESASMMDRDDVAGLVRLAKKYRCIEALFVTGERPEERYGAAREWLRKNGFESTAEYLVYCSELALSGGLFPHTNAGNLTRDEMKELAKTNASMGLMLETSSERLTERGMPHYLAPSKAPRRRIRVLEQAGELGIPMTTGLLIGIGESITETVDSLLEIRRIHEKFGNIQEIILQNFQPKHDTGMRGHPPAGESYFRRVVALARIAMPEMNVQVPPNLSPGSYQDFLSVGINDWGGISPLTPDHVNPEFAWPVIEKVREHTMAAGFDLRCRFPVYPEFVSGLPSDLKSRILEASDGEGLVPEEQWR